MLVSALPLDRMEIAFTARFYRPGHERSYEQVYVCDRFGKHRRQLTADAFDHSEVQWCGRDRLVWVERRRSGPRIVIAKGPGFKPKPTQGPGFGKFIFHADGGERLRGQPVFDVSNGSVRVTADGVRKRFPKSPEPGATLNSDSFQANIADEHSKEVTLSGPDFRRKVELKGILPTLVSLKNGVLYCTSYEQGELHADFEHHYVISKNSLRSVMNTCRPDIDPALPLWAGLTQGGRELGGAPGVAGAVWLAGIEVGDWKTRWTIVDGAVLARSVSIRPNLRLAR